MKPPLSVLAPAQAVLALWAFYRGFRAPSLWSLNYYQVSWPDGFLRRGLLGTLLFPLGCERFDPHLIWVIQCLVLVGAVGLLFRLGRGGRTAGLALCVFWASSAGTLFFNEVGYPDQLLLLLSAACAALLTRDKPKVWGVGLVLALAALIHETAVFTVLPLALVLWLRLPSPHRPALWKLLAPLGLVLALLALFSTSLPFAVLKRYDDLSIVCGHPLGRRDFLLYYQQALGDPFQCYYHRPELLGVVLPLMAVLALWILSGGALVAAPPKERWAVLLACWCPLLLGFMGTDKNRWLFLTLLQLLLLLGLPRPEAEPKPVRPGLSVASRAVLGLPLLLVVLAMRLRLFDGFAPRPLNLDGLKAFPAVVAGQFETLPLQ